VIVRPAVSDVSVSGHRLARTLHKRGFRFAVSA
jgi:hypothetical protein